MRKYLNIIILMTSVILFYSCDKKVTVSSPEDWQYEKAELILSSNPPGATIFVDDKNTGLITPDTIKWLSEGEHLITLKMNLFIDYSFNVNVTEQFATQIYHNYFDYSYNFAKINISSIPEGAKIFFDNSLIEDITPAIIKNILPGNHKLKLTFPEHRADSLDFFLKGGDNKNFSFTLTDTSVWVNYDKFNSLVKSYIINDVAVLSGDEIWAATSDLGIISVKGNTWKIYDKENSSLPGNGINKIEIDKYNKIWICTYSGLCVYDGTFWNVYTSANSDLPSNFVTDVFFKNNDTTLVTTQNGLVKFYNGNIEVIDTKTSSIPVDFLTAVEVDRFQNLWLGTASFGLLKYDGNQWQIFDFETNEFPGNSVSDIMEDSDGKLWVSMIERENKGEKGGIALLNNGQWSFPDLGVIFPSTEQIYQSDNGNIYFATRSGVINYKENGELIIFNASNSGLTRNDITSIDIDSKGNFWFGSIGGGLTKYKIWNQ